MGNNLQLCNFIHTIWTGGSMWQIAGKLKKHKNLNFFSTTFTTVFKICLYARCFDSSVCPHKIFWWHFADSSKLLKNHFVNELDLTSFKFAAIKWFFKSLEESAKCCQKIFCGHNDESKCLAYKHILKTVVIGVEEKFNFFVFFLNLIQVYQFTCNPPCWSPWWRKFWQPLQKYSWVSQNWV